MRSKVDGESEMLAEIVARTRGELQSGAIDPIAASTVLLERLRDSRIEVDALMFDVVFSCVLEPSPELSVGSPPSGTGCVECEQAGSWWVHLRRCVECGHVGCCDDSLSRHATAHATTAGHPLIRSFEPDEDWFWDYTAGEFVDGPELPPPASHPREQSAPGPADRLPSDWREQLADERRTR